MTTAQVKGGLFEQYGSTLAQLKPYSSARRWAAMALSRYGTFALREKMETLNGAAAGAAALKTLTRVAHSTTDLGGVRAIETQTFINANTTAADVTEINNTILSLSNKTYDSTPPANLDGNPLGTR